MLRGLMAERGLGVRALARHVPCDPGLISRFASGQRQPSPQMARRLDEALRAAGRLAAVAPAPGRPRILAACDDAAETVSVPCRIPDGRIIFVTVPRRMFLQQMGAASVLAAVGASRARPPRLPAAGEVSPAERFLLARRALMDLDNAAGPRDVIPAARRQVTEIRHISSALAGQDRVDLLAVQVQFADLIGWLYQDCGDYPAAGHWLDRALEWANTAGDQESVAFILARKSQLAGDMHDAATAVAVAEAAARLAGSQTRLGAVAAAYASHGHALAGDRSACERLCEQARSALETSAGGSHSPWAEFLDGPYIETEHARSLAALGDYQAAAERFDDAIGRLQPGYYRDRGVYLAREARAWAGAGEHEHAAALGTEALQVGAGTSSGRIFTELAGLERALEPAAPQPAAREFRDAMNSTVLRPA